MARKQQPQILPPPTPEQKDYLADFMSLLQHRRVDAQREHERLRREIELHEKAIRELMDQAALHEEIVRRCDTAILLDTPRQAPALSEREQE